MTYMLDMIIAKHFYMIRHGQTEANAAEVMAGSMDSPLTKHGREQAYAVQKIVASLSVKPKVIAHSHLSRARDTANIINEVLGVPMMEDPDLAELHAGDWEGVPWADCPDLLTGWPDPPGGEPFEEFMLRVKRGKNRHLEAHEGPVLIVCHGGVFRAFGKLYDLEVGSIIQNCHLYEFEPDPEGGSFPWRAWHYDLNGAEVLRNVAKPFHGELEDELASIAR